MNNKTKQSLGARSIACGPKFQWMPCMREIHGAICVKVNDGQPWLWAIDDSIVEDEGDGDALPDLDDPATAGCFEHSLLPAAGYNDARIDAYTDREGKVFYNVVYRPDPISFPSRWLRAVDDDSSTKVDAIVAALEAAP